MQSLPNWLLIINDGKKTSNLYNALNILFKKISDEEKVELNSKAT